MFFESKKQYQLWKLKKVLRKLGQYFKLYKCCDKHRTYWGHRKHQNSGIFHLKRVPVQFFKIDSASQLSEEDLLYLRINIIE